MDAQIQQLIELQTEQNQLLKKHLWRFRFSLLNAFASYNRNLLLPRFCDLHAAN
jgi:hypothetical protein